MSGKLVLVTGATGYIASRLIPCLLDKGYRVRALARQPQRLPGRSWSRHVELIPAEALDPSSLARSGWTAKAMTSVARASRSLPPSIRVEPAADSPGAANRARGP